MDEFRKLLAAHAERVEDHLSSLLDDTPLKHELQRPKRLVAAIRHSALDGGKRLRPFLVMESAALFGVQPEQSIHAACALECIHCYSLVHDDLPAMDDDALRRGRPTTHIAFDEATAILAGDALLTFAFDLLSQTNTHSDPSVRVELVSLFARNAGLGGMVGGQMLDLEAEEKSLDPSEITTMQAMKTGALLRCACETGAVLGGASAQQRASLLEFGAKIGAAFQLADDILDVTSDAATMGKHTGKDADRGKETLVDHYGLADAQKHLNLYLEEALQALSDFGPEGTVLRQAARFIVERTN